MELIVLGSNSQGNCYLLVGRDEVLIIEAGIKFAEVKKALNYDISKIVGCLISHEHNDHAGYYMEYLRFGFPVLSPEAVYMHKGYSVMSPFAKLYNLVRGTRLAISRLFLLKYNMMFLLLGTRSIIRIWVGLFFSLIHSIVSIPSIMSIAG